MTKVSQPWKCLQWTWRLLKAGQNGQNMLAASCNMFARTWRVFSRCSMSSMDRRLVQCPAVHSPMSGSQNSTVLLRPWIVLICFVANRLERSSICSRMGWQRTSMPFLHFPRLLPFNLLLGLTVTTSITILNWFMNIYDMYVRTDLRSGEWSIMEICLKKKSTGHWSLLWALVNFKYVHDEYPRLCGQEQYRDYDAAARFWTRTQPMQLSNVWVCLLDPIVPELSLST